LPVAAGVRDHTSLEEERMHQALTFESNETSGGCSEDQCKSCCCMDTKLQAYVGSDTLYEVPFSVAKVGYRDLGTCKGTLGSKHDSLGACGKAGCTSCEHEGLPKCENTPPDTCCRFLTPGYPNWRLTLQPWWAMQGTDCNSVIKKSGVPADSAGPAVMQCCIDNDARRGFAVFPYQPESRDPAWCQA